MPNAVLVTGGAGFVGSHVCKSLAGAGFLPVVIDDLSTGRREFVKWGPLVQADIANRTSLSAVIEEYEIGAVMHLAAAASVAESMADPAKYFRNNALRTIELLELLLECGVRKVVFSSSCSVYGVPDSVPIAEHHPNRPISPYGESKLFCERLLHWYAAVHGFAYVALRYFNAAGADLDVELGEGRDGETHLIPLAMDAALGRQPELMIFGNDYSTPDGTAIRDYAHVSDLADAHLRALAYLEAQAAEPELVVNLGSGRGHSVAEVVAAVEGVAGRPIKRRVVPRRPGDPPILVADPGLALARLAWRPKNSDLRMIVQTAWQWHLKQWPGSEPAGSSPREPPIATGYPATASQTIALRHPTSNETASG